jgi:hypothetical protein
MREHLNWYEVQQLVAGFSDKTSYQYFKAEMKARFNDLSQQIVEAKAIMHEAQRMAAEDNTKPNRIAMSIAQNHRRYLRRQAETINAARYTAKQRAIKLAQAK